jgi:hypothetical protein
LNERVKNLDFVHKDSDILSELNKNHLILRKVLFFNDSAINFDNGIAIISLVERLGDTHHRTRWRMTTKSVTREYLHYVRWIYIHDNHVEYWKREFKQDGISSGCRF